MSKLDAEPSLKEIRAELAESSYCAEIINECKKVYEEASAKGQTASAPVHLKALGALCAYAEQQGFDCSWLYEAFASELKPQYQTSLQKFYLGAFAEAMKLNGSSLNQTKAAIKQWIGLSPRNVEECHAHFMRTHTFNQASPQLILPNQILQLASAVINNISLPFPNGRPRQAFEKLMQSIKTHGFENASLPFEHDFAEKKRPR